MPLDYWEFEFTYADVSTLDFEQSKSNSYLEQYSLEIDIFLTLVQLIGVIAFA